MSETRIDVKVEQVESAPAAKKHPNTCPSCGSHYRDDELESALYVCAQCGHHFRMSAHSRIGRSEEHTSELQSPCNLVCRLLLEKKKKNKNQKLLKKKKNKEKKSATHITQE